MRNLNLDILQIQHLPFPDNNIVRSIQINDKYFVLTKKTVHLVQNDNNFIIKCNVHNIDWVPVENILYMGDGEVFHCYNIQTEEINVITIPGGYVIHEWNPSQDRLALIDDQGILKIVLLDAYNSQYTCIGEYKLDSVENSQFINLGWGSQSTQFRGSAGKYGDIKSEIDVSQGNQDRSLRIAWRDDGDIFAVNFIRNGQRIFKMFSCECEFLYESECKPGLCAELAWKPDGSLIAGANGHNIIFFEKNGLHRYEFKLPTNKTVKKIQWNPLGDILMIWQQSTDNSEISLWTCTNFEWYLKQSLVFKNDNAVNSVEWSDKKWLDVITTKNLIRYSWKWTTFVSDTDDLGAIVVVDGNVLRVTVTSAHIMPPPFSSYKIKFTKPVNTVAFGHMHSTLAVLLNDYTVKILDITKSDYVEKFSGQILNDTVPLALNHFVYDDKQSILYCIASLIDNRSIVNKYVLRNVVSLEKSYECVSSVSDLLRWYDSQKNEYYLGLCDGMRILVCQPEAQLLPDADLPLIEDDETENGGHYSLLYVNNSFCSISLNSQRFYYNGKKIANNVTSYLFCHGYLLLTTTENKLLCVKFNQKGLLNLETNQLFSLYTRSIPSGALLISAVPRTRKIILQVPRGELEIINPRVLAIDEIDRLFSSKKHLEAYMVMRTDRINPNIFYDLNPTRFVNDIEDFIKNIKNCEYLDVFLTQLQDSNVSEELYCNCFEKHLPIQMGGSKVFIVADKMIEAMQNISINYYLQSIISAYLSKGTDEDLEKALEELSAARHREESGVMLRVPVDSTLEHMIILSSVEKLYDVALGMDKLELIMWVASKSQRDPLEYIPFLRDLVSMEDNYRNYKINCHIKRFEKAFAFLIKCNDVLEELKQFISKNYLYKLILKYLQPNNQWYKPLLHLYAEYLSKESRYKEAGFIFMKINSYESALDNFVKGCCVKEALTTFHLLGSNVSKMNNSLVELASRLVDRKQFQEASLIYDTVLNNYEESISVMIKGCLWSDALYLAHKNHRLDIIESEIKPAIVNFSQDLCSSLHTYEDEFCNLKTRLQTLRNEKIVEFRQNSGSSYDHGEYTENMIDCVGRNIDLESVVSTAYSRTTSQRSKSSHMTSASSRKKKRLEKKVLQIREGSAFENIAIIRRLYIMITEVQNLGQTVSETCMQLISYSEHYDKAVTLHSSYGKLIELMDSSTEVIWPQEMLIPVNPVTAESEVYKLNMEHLDIQYRFPPQEVKKNWKVLLIL